ncbi:MAG: Oligo,6-glucosidase, partial [Actinomycetota bacterium]
DNARTPMLWNDGSNAGFTTGKPWLKVNDNYTEINAEAALADKGSVFWHYRDLIALRHNHDIVVNGTLDLIWPEHEQLFAYERKLDGKTLTVVANFSDHSVALPSDLPVGDVLVGTAPTGRELSPWQSFAILS